MEVDETLLTFEFEKAFEAEPTINADDDDSPTLPGTEICKFFMKGACMKGANCPWKHSKNEKAVVCKHWLRGLCKKGDICEFLHEYDLSKMPECYFFSKFGIA
jgi:cleavage and polyadenylation specificity factor subunit 4